MARLPAESTSFVGRAQELNDTRALLGAGRLVTLTGPGGVGKSRLAVRAAREMARGFADGVQFVDLSAVRRPELLLAAVNAALGLSDGSEEPLRQVVVYLRTANLLLVLDNVEHLAEAVGDLVGTVLSTSPGVRVLVTSRHTLGVFGEQLLPVAPLAVGHDEDWTAARGQPAVRLFADRALAVMPGFVLDRPTTEDVVRVCQTLDGIPLAIEAATVWLRTLPLNEILRRLDRTFQLLSRGNRGAPTRQQTLYATIDWSYALCSTEERLLWERLSVFPGDFDLAAVAALYEGEEIAQHELIDLLAHLVDKSVLTSEIGQSAARFRLLRTLRQFGQLKLNAAGESRRIRRRHAEHYLGLARTAAHDWLSGRRQVPVSTLLTREHDNLHTALTFSLDGENPAAGLELAASMTYYWLGCGVLGEATRWLHLALTANPAPSRHRAQALWAKAHVAVIMGRPEQARPLAQEAEDWARVNEDDEVLAHVLLIRGTDALQASEFERSGSLCDEAVARFELAGNATFLALSMALRSIVSTFRGEFQHAAAFTEQARRICAEHGEHWASSYVHYSAALTAWIQGDHTRARTELDAGLGVVRSLNDLLAAGMLLDLRAWLADSTGNPGLAAELLGISQTVWPAAGSVKAYQFTPWAVRHAACEQQLRAKLGDTAYENAFLRGTQAASRLADAVAHVLGEGAPRHEAQAEPAPLSRREQQVAELVAAGLSNRNIAERLNIAPRTAETHVNNVLNKLGFNSRARLAAWITEQRR
ncbi:non-specific serine/threonine protein kinase [Crossiella equi]|uniref:Non-specific serine/threonine protein kinase n=2 Tax=Crossiella equi TaxID=130796 RepID=A0ABS5APS2_9PSEU|nr:LuxR C-terminal-related transcriptional regulator [Crossiella equi]MBP2478564.1 non-specific serine/threonine protein kinase [Crossiella equi]